MCPHCGAKNRPDSVTCGKCGGSLVPEVVGTCPRCSNRLHAIVSGEIAVGACEGCGGVELDTARLSELLLQSKERQRTLIARMARLKTGHIKKLSPTVMCPSCRSVMPGAPMGMLSPEPVYGCLHCPRCFLDEGALASIMGLV